MAAFDKIARRLLVCAGLLLVLSACAPKPASGIVDPNEEANRRVFEANLELDSKVFKNAGSGTGVPPPIRQGIINFSANFGLPRSVVNSVLQGRLDRVVQNTVRFAINSTVGIGGLFDPASVINIPAADTDFGETLYVWGVGEGNYVMLPLVGPTTQRHAAGRVVDLFTNPLFWILPSPERFIIGPTSSVLATAASRGENAEIFEDLILNAADPYAQTRIFYLENRRFKLGTPAGEDEGLSYDDFYDN